MTFGANLAAALPELRAHAESLMGLTLRAYRPSGTTTVGGKVVPAYDDEGTTSGKVQGSSVSTRDTSTEYLSIGGVERPVLRAGLHIPVSATVPVAGRVRGKEAWEYVVEAVGDADPALLGRRYMVVNVPAKSYATARRLDVVEVGAP